MPEDLDLEPIDDELDLEPERELSDPGFDPFKGIQERAAAEPAPTSVGAVGLQLDPLGEGAQLQRQVDQIRHSQDAPLYGAISDLTFNQDDRIAKAVPGGGAYLQEQAAAQAENPGGFTTGQVAAGLAMPAAGAKLAAKVSGKTWGAVAAWAAKNPGKAGALWGAVSSGLRGVGYENVESWEDAARIFGVQSLIGGTIGGVAGKVLPAIGRSLKKTTQAGLSSTNEAAKILKGFGKNKKQIAALQREYGDDLIHYANSKIDDTPLEVLKTARATDAQRADVGKSLEGFYRKAEQLMPEGTPVHKENLRAYRDLLRAETETKNSPYHAVADEIDELLGPQNEGKGLTNWWTKRKVVDQHIRFNDPNSATSDTRQQIYRGMRDALQKDMEATVEATAGKEAAKALRDTNKLYGTLSEKADELYSWDDSLKDKSGIGTGFGKAMQVAGRAAKNTSATVVKPYLFIRNISNKVDPRLAQTLEEAWQQSDSKFLATYHAALRTNPELRKVGLKYMKGLVTKKATGANPVQDQQESDTVEVP